MHKLGREGKEQAGEGAVYSQGVEPQAAKTSLFYMKFFKSRRLDGIELPSWRQDR